MFWLVIISLTLITCQSLFPSQTDTDSTTPTLEPPTEESPPTPTLENLNTLAADQIPAEQPVLITGKFKYSNDFVVETYYVEHMVALVDMTGFVQRDQEWELPVESQVLGFVSVNAESNRGTFRLQLPARPVGELNDVDNDGQFDNGLQIFAVAYWPNLSGGPFAEGDDYEIGWPSYLASITTDRENKDEVTGGKLVVWTPDDQQQFPTEFGEDGMLFTEDDPVDTLPAGYSVIDLDQMPFEINREAEETMTLYEPQDVAIKDFTHLSYTKAFDQMFEIVRKEYAFNGIEGKQPDWDALYKELSIKAKTAESPKDPVSFYLAIQEFTFAFRDGHVSLDGGDMGYLDYMRKTSYGYGFAIRELDDGRVIVAYVLPDGPAANAGIEIGDEITQFNYEPIAVALSSVQPESAPFSTDFGLRYQQARYLLRSPDETDAAVTFINPGGTAQSVELPAVQEQDSFYATSLYTSYDPYALPVEFEILDSGIGYIRINSNYDDLNLIIRLFERALKTFEEAELSAIIIDMRLNFGGASLGLAGFLTDKEIPLGQREYYSDKSGGFEPDGPRNKVIPNVNQYRFDQMALLVDQSCYSACEIESYGFSQVPGMMVIGQYPTGGVEAEVARGQFDLPEGISLQIPTGRYTLPDGSIFLEGVGVVPTLLVPIDENTVLSDEDIVLKVAETTLLTP